MIEEIRAMVEALGASAETAVVVWCAMKCIIYAIGFSSLIFALHSFKTVVLYITKTAYGIKEVAESLNVEHRGRDHDADRVKNDILEAIRTLKEQKGEQDTAT